MQENKIIGKVKFNDSLAFVFEKPITSISNSSNNECYITLACIDELTKCYVYNAGRCSSEEYNKWINTDVPIYEYYEFEKKIIKPIKEAIQREYRISIVEKIFKNGFREVGKYKFRNEYGLTIKIVDITYASLDFGCVKDILDLDIPYIHKAVLNSIFCKSMEYCNILNENKFCIRCYEGHNKFLPVIITF